MATSTACGLRRFHLRAGRVLLVACTAVLMSALSCARGGGGLGSWPEKSITPPAASRIVEVQEINDMWILYFNCSLSMDEVRADLESKLAALGYLEMPQVASQGLNYLYISPDGRYSLNLAKPPKLPPIPGVTQSDYQLSLTHHSLPTSLLKHAQPLAPAGD